MSNNKKKFTLRDAEEVREKITNERLKAVRNRYKELYKKLLADVRKGGKDKLTERKLREILVSLESQINDMNQILETDIKEDMLNVSLAIVENKRRYLTDIGVKQNLSRKAFFYVPKSVVQTIANGTIYQKGWKLSSAIWGQSKYTDDILQRIIANGKAAGKSAYDIALDLEKYVQPGAQKKSRVIHSWIYDASGNKKKQSFYFGDVDYNAQRLARTMVSHAYQQSFEMVNRHDPFIIGYRWLTSNFHGRVCPICRERAENDDYGFGPGVFPKDELPLDHPNGMCTFEAVFDENVDIVQRIYDWSNAEYGKYPEMDRFAESFINGG